MIDRLASPKSGCLSRPARRRLEQDRLPPAQGAGGGALRARPRADGRRGLPRAGGDGGASRRRRLAFQTAGVEAVVFTEMAYTQSLVPMRALATTQVPIIVWNTQQLTRWPEDADWDVVMLNSGLAGLPETTHALVRSGRHFQIVTGHMTDEAALARLRGYLVAAASEAAACAGRASAWSATPTSTWPT